MDNNRACHEVSKAAALPVQHHADQPKTVEDAGLHIDGSHEVSSDRLVCIDGPPAFFDHTNSRDPFTRSPPFPYDFENREISPIDSETDENRQRGSQGFWHYCKERKPFRKQKQENQSG